MSQKTLAYLILHNLKKLEPILIIFGTIVIIINNQSTLHKTPHFLILLLHFGVSEIMYICTSLLFVKMPFN